MTNLGMILVSDDGIKVQHRSGSGTSDTAFDEATIENMQEAARVLASWMDLKFEDVASECRRIHNSDQFDAFLREAINDE